MLENFRGVGAGWLRVAANTLSPAAEPSWSDRLRVAVVNHNLSSVIELFEIDTQVQIDIVDIVDGLCREAIAQARPDDIICALISKLPRDNRLELFANKSVIPSPVVRANDVELAKFYVANGFEHQIASSDAHHVQMEIKDLVFPHQFQKQLTATNANPDFWERLDRSHSGHDHHHDHGAHEHEHGDVHESEYKIQGNFSLAKARIQTTIDTVFSNVKSNLPNDPEHVFLLYAFMKAQDQGAPIPGFVMSERRQFERIFNMTNGGQTIGDVTRVIPDGKAYLVKEFALDSFYAKLQVILENSNISHEESRRLATSCLEKFILERQNNISFGLDVADLSLASFFDGIADIAKVAYKNKLSSLVLILALGSVTLCLRAVNDQLGANAVRDNIGALIEATAFFVLVNGGLDNFFHSTALIAPSCVAIAVYDKLARPVLSTTYAALQPVLSDFVHGSNKSTNATSSEGGLDAQDIPDIEHNGPMADDLNAVEGSYANCDANKLLESLQGIRNFFDEDAMWSGLRNAQLVYEGNHLEAHLRTDIDRLMQALGGAATPQNINQLLRVEFKQTLKDMSEMMRAYVEVCEQKNPGSGIKERFQHFCNSFARDGILLSDASYEVEWAVFCMRHEAGLVTWDDRIKASFPELPSARELLLAAGVIGIFLVAIEIYKTATGKEKEPISSYLLDFPTHLFKWLHLDQLYDHLGGGAASTEWFKKFFAIFNLTENSSHFYIAAIPIINYIRRGSKMFEDLHHGPINWLAYLDQRATGGAIRKRMVNAPTEAMAPNALPTAAALQTGARVPVAV